MRYRLFLGHQTENAADDAASDATIQEAAEVAHDRFTAKQGLETNACCIHTIATGQSADNTGDGACSAFIFSDNLP